MPIEISPIELADSEIRIGMMPNNRLEATRINAGRLSDNPHIFLMALVLRYDHVRGTVMLLITHQDV